MLLEYRLVSVSPYFSCYSILAHLYLEPRIVYGYPAGGLVGGHGGEILKAFIGFGGH